IVPRPAHFPLFPFTTLFRSTSLCRWPPGPLARIPVAPQVEAVEQNAPHRESPPPQPAAPPEDRRRGRCRPDRRACCSLFDSPSAPIPPPLEAKPADRPTSCNRG